MFALLIKLIRSPTHPEITPGYRILSHTSLYGAPILTPDAHGENISQDNQHNEFTQEAIWLFWSHQLCVYIQIIMHLNIVKPVIH